MKWVLTYLRTRMTEERLNNYLLMHIHKNLADTLNIKDIAEEFISGNVERKTYFGTFN